MWVAHPGLRSGGQSVLGGKPAFSGPFAPQESKDTAHTGARTHRPQSSMGTKAPSTTIQDYACVCLQPVAPSTTTAEQEGMPGYMVTNSRGPTAALMSRFTTTHLTQPKPGHQQPEGNGHSMSSLGVEEVPSTHARAHCPKGWGPCPSPVAGQELQNDRAGRAACCQWHSPEPGRDHTPMGNAARHWELEGLAAAPCWLREGMLLT